MYISFKTEFCTMLAKLLVLLKLFPFECNSLALQTITMSEIQRVDVEVS